jgi:hypothetical protein
MTEKENTELVYNYSKSPDYRVYNADGIFGGTMPNGKINFNIFSEIAMVPEKIIFDINKNRTLKEKRRIKEFKNEINRELQAGFVMDLQTAKSFQIWLEDKIKTIEAQIKK